MNYFVLNEIPESFHNQVNAKVTKCQRFHKDQCERKENGMFDHWFNKVRSMEYVRESLENLFQKQTHSFRMHGRLPIVEWHILVL